MLWAVSERVRGSLAWWRSRSVLLRDSIGAVAFTAVALAPALAHNGVVLGELPPRTGGALAALLALAQTLPLAVCRGWPAACLAVVGIAFAINQCLGYPGSFTSTGLILALYAAGAHERRLRRGLAAAASAAYVGLAIMLAVRVRAWIPAEVTGAERVRAY